MATLEERLAELILLVGADWKDIQAALLTKASDSEALAMSATDRVLTPGNLGAITNVNNGIPKLDSGGKIPSTLLPSYVDDVIEVADFASLPVTGEAGKIYVTLDDGGQYRWGGSSYVQFTSSPGTTDDVIEGSVNLYFTDTRADARANNAIDTRIGDEDTDLAAAYTAAKA